MLAAAPHLTPASPEQRRPVDLMGKERLAAAADAGEPLVPQWLGQLPTHHQAERTGANGPPPEPAAEDAPSSGHRHHRPSAPQQGLRTATGSRHRRLPRTGAELPPQALHPDAGP